MPSVAYTDPEVAWMGLSESRGQGSRDRLRQGGCSRGRPAAVRWAWDGDEGLTKMISDKATKRVLGVGMVGPHAGDLIAEAMLALEMGAMSRTSR